eukprot:18192-Heterococcus_DN1.PRE.1
MTKTPTRYKCDYLITLTIVLGLCSRSSFNLRHAVSHQYKKYLQSAGCIAASRCCCIAVAAVSEVFADFSMFTWQIGRATGSNAGYAPTLRCCSVTADAVSCSRAIGASYVVA